MINWQETEQIIDELTAVLTRGESAVLAVIYAIRGSTYRRPGAKMLIRADGAAAGNISGGCLEEDLQLRGHEVLKSGVAAKVHYNTSDDEDRIWGLGLGCNGEVDLILHRWTPAELPLAQSIQCRMKAGKPFEISFPLNLDGNEVPQVLSNRLTIGTVYVDSLEPPPWIFVFGAGDDAIPLVKLGAEVGFRVWVADHRPTYAVSERFPSAKNVMLAHPNDDLSDWPLDKFSFAVIKTHATQKDREWLDCLGQTPVRYIGLLGPRDRRDALLETVSEKVRSRVYGPAGLDLGGDGMQQVALSMVAEMLALYADRPPIHLRDRTGSIHQKECLLDGA